MSKPGETGFHDDKGRLKFINILSYKNISWIFKTSEVVGGRKNAIKRFVNTDRQSVEDLGLQVRGYTITGCIALLGDEEDYPKKRDAVLDILESPGTGRLVHPMFGVLNNIAVIGYTFNETVTEIGIGELTVEFAISNVDGQLEVEASTDQEAKSEDTNVKKKAELSIVDKFLANTGLQGVYKAAKDKIEDIGKAFGDAVAFAEKTTSEIDKMSNTVADFQNDLLVLAATPQKLSQSITNVFQTINASVATAAATFEVYKEFFGFGFLTDIELDFDTAANNKTKTNRRVLNNTMNALALSGSYVSVAQKDYRAVDELDSDLEILENQMDLIRAAPEFDPDLFAAILDARKTFLEIVADKKPSLSKIIEVEIELNSSRALSYQYYGDDSESEDITKINGGFGIMYSGKVKIFSV